MRPPVCASHLRFLCRATALAAVTALAACSSDALRFEEQLTTATTLTANQQTIIERRGPVAQPYPGDAPKTPNGIRSSQHDTSRYGGATAPKPSIQRQPLSAANSTASAPVKVSEPETTVVKYAPAQDGAIVLSPQKREKPKLRLVGVDRTSTGSVEPVTPKTAPKAQSGAAAKPNAGTKKGWTKTGGTWVTVGSGETLYNLSRRFGVPVRAILNANDIKNANSVAAGSKVLIPTYNYSTSAPVSAPDNNPETKASRSSRGFQGQARNGKIVLPKQRASQQSAKTDSVTTGSISEESQSKTKQVKRAKAPESTIAARATESVKTAAKTNSGAFRWPAQGRVIKKFGDRMRSGANDGIDISVPVGTPVKASENGTVIYSGSELEEFGNLILLSHAGGWVTAYGNASSRMVKRGDKVKRGQVIAKSGKTGSATVPQLHFEIRKNSKPVNPLKHLSKG